MTLLHPTLSAERILTCLAFLLAGALFFGRLGALPLFDPDEGRNAEVAREMDASGSWIVPTFDGAVYLDKPAFFFRTVALSLNVFGDSEFAARLPSVLFGLGTLALVFFFCRREFGEPTAATAVAVVATMPLFVAFARLVIFDMALAFFVCAAVMAGHQAEEREGAARRRWHLAGALAAGTATLIKGPVGFIIPWLVLSASFLWSGRRAAIARMFAPINLIAFLAVVLPWFFALAHQRPDFVHYGLVEESFHRFTTASFRRTEPFYYYVPVLASSCLAWSLLFPESMVVAWRARARWSRADRLFIVWALVVVIFFSISQSKRGAYVLTAAIALGVLIARLVARAWSQRESRATAIVLRGAGLLAVLCAICGGAIACQLAFPRYLVEAFRIPEDQLALITPSLLPLLVVFLGIMALSIAALRSRRAAIGFASFLSFSPLLMIALLPGLLKFGECKSSRELAARIQTIAPRAEVVCLNSFPQGLPFYLRHTIPLISADGRELTSNYVLYLLAQHQPLSAEVIALDERESWLASRAGEVLLVTDEKHRAVLAPIAAGHHVEVVLLADGWYGALLPPEAGR